VYNTVLLVTSQAPSDRPRRNSRAKQPPNEWPCDYCRSAKKRCDGKEPNPCSICIVRESATGEGECTYSNPKRSRNSGIVNMRVYDHHEREKKLSKRREARRSDALNQPESLKARKSFNVPRQDVNRTSVPPIPSVSRAFVPTAATTSHAIVDNKVNRGDNPHSPHANPRPHEQGISPSQVPPGQLSQEDLTNLIRNATFRNVTIHIHNINASEEKVSPQVVRSLQQPTFVAQSQHFTTSGRSSQNAAPPETYFWPADEISIHEARPLSQTNGQYGLVGESSFSDVPQEQALPQWSYPPFIDTLSPTTSQPTTYTGRYPYFRQEDGDASGPNVHVSHPPIQQTTDGYAMTGESTFGSLPFEDYGDVWMQANPVNYGQSTSNNDRLSHEHSQINIDEDIFGGSSFGELPPESMNPDIYLDRCGFGNNQMHAKVLPNSPSGAQKERYRWHSGMGAACL